MKPRGASRRVRSAMPPVGQRLVTADQMPGFGTRLGRALLALSPRPLRRAVRELQGVRTRNVYAGAEQSRLLLDWIMRNITADEAVKLSIRQLRNRARDLERNNPYVKGYLRAHKLQVIGPHGMIHRAEVRDSSGELVEKVNNTIDAGFEAWAVDPVTVDGRFPLVELEQQLMGTMVRDGEAFCRMWRYFQDNRFGLALEPIDPDQVDEQINRRLGDGQNEIRMGVEVNTFGRPLQYWTRNHWQRSSPPIPIGASEIIHLQRPDTVNQTRSVTWCHSFMVALKLLHGMIEAELVATRSAAAKMGFLQWKNEALAGGEIGEDDVEIDPETGEERPLESIPMEANPGSIEEIPWGREFVAWDPQHPSTGFAPFLKNMLRAYAAGGGPAYNTLAKDLEGVSYSSLRWGMLDENDYWQDCQTHWIRSFRRRIRQEFLASAMLVGELKLPSRRPADFAAHSWTPTGRDWVDPLKEVEAGILGVANGQRSRTELAAARGTTVERIFRDLEREMKLAEKLGLKVDGGLSPTTTNVNAPDPAGASNNGA